MLNCFMALFCARMEVIEWLKNPKWHQNWIYIQTGIGFGQYFALPSTNNKPQLERVERECCVAQGFSKFKCEIRYFCMFSSSRNNFYWFFNIFPELCRDTYNQFLKLSMQIDVTYLKSKIDLMTLNEQHYCRL